MNIPWPRSPCSPNASPWSPATTNAVVRRQQPGEEAAVRRERERRHRRRLFEDDAVTRDAIEVWRRDAAGTVRRQVVRPRGVERDDHDIVRARWRVAPGASRRDRE